MGIGAALLGPMSGWSQTRRRIVNLIFVLVVAPIAYVRGLAIGDVFTQPDTIFYLGMARGLPAMLPFASRPLAPLLVRGLSHLPGMTIERAFLALGVVCLVWFVGVVGFLVIESGAPVYMLLAVGVMYFWPLQFDALVMPDLLYAALMCGLLLLLRRQRLLAAALLLGIMAVSREATLLTLACYLMAGWKRLNWRQTIGALASTVGGLIIVKYLSANALPNNEHLPPTLYMIAKMPWNAARNLFGLALWADVYPACGVPKWQMALHLGPVHQLGVCGFAKGAPIEVYGYALAAFGLLPLLLWRMWPGASRFRLGSGSMLLRFALIYGGFSYVMAPLLGESLMRLYGYSWPLWLVGLPMLLQARRATFRGWGWAALFVAMHGVLSWLPGYLLPHKLLITAIVFSVVAWALLRWTLVLDSEPGETRSRASLKTAPQGVR